MGKHWCVLGLEEMVTFGDRHPPDARRNIAALPEAVLQL